MNGHTCLPPSDLPPFPQLWARWTATAAAFAAARKSRGPRVLPLVAWFENGHDGGAILHALPGGRAVLWGEITTVHPTGAAVFPFGYRWENNRWYQVEPIASEHRAAALPGIWTTNETVDNITALIGRDDEQRRAAVVTMVCAAEIGTVTRALVTDVFGDPQLFDPEYAVSQFAMAGALAAGPAAPSAGFPIAAAVGGAPATSLPGPWAPAMLPTCHATSGRRTDDAGPTPSLHGLIRPRRPR